MKTFGLLALGGAMGLQFEDLSYDNLRGAFSKVNQFENFYKFFLISKIKWNFRLFQRSMAIETSILPSLAMTTFHTSNGATQTVMDLSHFLNPLDVDQNQDSGTHLQ